MNCFVIPCLLISALGADEKSIPRIRLEGRGEVVGAVLSPDEKNLASITENTDDGNFVDLVVWDVVSRSKTTLLNKIETRSFCFSDDSALLAITDDKTNTVHLWKREAAGKWGVLRVLHVGAAAPKPNIVASVFSADGRHIFVSLAVSTESSPLWTVEKWDIVTGRIAPFPIKPVKSQFPVCVFMVASPDGKTLCLTTTDGLICVDALSGRWKYTIPQCFSIPSVSPDGRLGAVVNRSMTPTSTPKDVTFWNLSDGTQRCVVGMPEWGAFGNLHRRLPLYSLSRRERQHPSHRREEGRGSPVVESGRSIGASFLTELGGNCLRGDRTQGCRHLED